MEIDVRGGPRRSKGVPGAISPQNRGFFLLIWPPLVDPGVLLKDPGVLLKDSGALLTGPGVLLKDPGVLLKDHGALLKD